MAPRIIVDDVAGEPRPRSASNDASGRGGGKLIRGSLLVGVMLALLVLPVNPILAAPPAGDRAASPAGEADGLDPGALDLRAGKIFLNPDRSLHKAPAAALAREKAGRFVVQLDGPLTPQRRRALANAGARLGVYLPTHAYIVKSDNPGELARGLANVGCVRWFGRYDKGWKIDPELGLRSARSAGRAGGKNPDRLSVIVVLFEGEDGRAAAARIGVFPGAMVTSVDPRPDGAQLGVTLPRPACPALAELEAVHWVEEAPQRTQRNDTNKWIVQSDVAGFTPVWNHGLHGEGQIGGHIDGPVNASHCSFSAAGKFVLYSSSDPTPDPHGTHTAGTFVGDDPGGLYPGLAPEAKLAFTDLFDLGTGAGQLSDYAALQQDHDAGARVHSNSWGTDFVSTYTVETRDVDQFGFNNEDDLVLFAVTDYDHAVYTPENAKNCLAVTLSSDTPNENQQCFAVGRAPTIDGRRKPEVVAPGCETISSDANTSCGFIGANFTGTSMACPAVAGAGVLVRQYFMAGFHPSGAANPGDSRTPTGALVKAMLINSAVDMTGIAGFPSDKEGWGRVLLDNALYFSGDARRLMVLEDLRNASGRTTGQNTAYPVHVDSSGQPLKVTLVWTEKEATIGANPAYINNLDLVVVAPGPATYLGNVFSGGQSATGGAADVRNNVEQVLLNSPPIGDYTISVNASAVNTLGPQGYALVATGAVSPPVMCVRGDVNNDGVVDGRDAQLFCDVVFGGSGTAQQLCAADINGDSVRNATDVTMFINCLLTGICP